MFSAICSSLFRLLSFVFLRIIPTRLAVPLLPPLYFLHILLSRPSPTTTNWAEKGANPPPPPRQKNPLAVLLFSLPSPSRFLTWSNIAINTTLLIASTDLLATPFFDAAHDVVFTRLGAVYPDSVKILARYPNQPQFSLLYREFNDSAAVWKHGPTFHLKHESDWVDTVTLHNLWPSTSYEYVFAYENKTIMPYPTHPIHFRTFPDPDLHSPSHFSFVATSCITPNFPYQGPLHKHTMTGFDQMADYLEQKPVEFMMFLGDFIYADVPAYIGDDQEAYRRLYRRNYQSPSFKKVYERLPIFHAYDDHEFINNYIGDSLDLPPFANASSAYDLYAANANYDSIQPGQNYYDFQHGDTAFFVLDTRRYRSALADQSDETYRTMLGDRQLTALYDWLHKVNETSPFKFIISSVPFTSLWTHDAQIDSWAGYAVEKAALLDALHTVPNVIIISGDRHEFAAIEISSGDPEHHVVREFSTSPLNMFYIPYIHTLRPESQSSFTRNITVQVNGTVEVEQEKVPYEKTIKYIPHGNTKWSTFEVDTTDINKPILRLETVIGGKPVYHLEITGTPTKPPNHASLGSLVTTNVKDLFSKIGLKPARWF